MSTKRYWTGQIIVQPVISTNWFSKIALKCRGKRDGKQNIPTVYANTIPSSPTIHREQARVDECMAYIAEKIDVKTAVTYVDTEALMAHFWQAEQEYRRMHDRLKDELKPNTIIVVDHDGISSTQQDMLKAKRTNEEKLDSIGLRLRRFREYQKNLEALRTQLSELEDTLEKDYQAIKTNHAQIQFLDSLLDTFFLKYSAKIDKRLSWYWQGVLKKHPDSTTMPQVPPNTTNQKSQMIHTAKRQALEKNISDLEQAYTYLLALPKL